MTRRILVVKEKPQDLKRLLDSAGYSVDLSSDAKKALTMALSGNGYGLLIVSSEVAKENNYKILKKLRSIEKLMKTPLMVFGDSNSAEDHIHSLKNGSDDYLASPMDDDVFLAHVSALFRRTEILCNECAGRFADMGQDALDSEIEETPDKDNGKDHLTRRQLEILRLMSKGHSNKQIAQMLYLSETTIKAHLRTIFKKLRVKNRTQAVLVALNQGVGNSK